MLSIHVDIPSHEYDVSVGRGIKYDIVRYLMGYTSNKNILIVADDFFKKGYVAQLVDIFNDNGFSVYTSIMKGGKVSKTFNEVLKLYGELEINNFARDSTLIALGGGVVGDLSGFVASTWYRGMNFLHIPTTLMGMVDSSIGGKVAINYRQSTNAIGNYYHPIANFMDLEFINSLSDRDYFSGLAEVVKCSVIADTEFIEYLNRYKTKIINRDDSCLVHCIKRSIEIKIEHVKNDVNEGGKRLMLNYGHTLGHAIEMATHSDSGETFRHGEGVSLGISASLFISQSHLKMTVEDATIIRELLESFNLPINFSASDYGFSRNNLIKKCMKLIMKDKKRKDNKLRFILVGNLGAANVYTDVPRDVIKAAFKSVILE